MRPQELHQLVLKEVVAGSFRVLTKYRAEGLKKVWQVGADLWHLVEHSIHVL